MTITLKDGPIPFDEKMRGDIRVGANASSVLSKLGTPEAVDLKTSTVVSIDSYSGAQAAHEGVDKRETPITFAVARTEGGMLQSQIRLSKQALMKSEAEGLSILEAAQSTMAGHLGADIDIVSLHNASPDTAEPTVEFRKGLATGADRVAHQRVANERPDEALRTVLFDLMENEKEVSGIAVSPAFFAKLAQVQDTAGRLLYPQFTLSSNPDDWAFDGHKVVRSRTVSNKKGLPGAPSGVEFVVGDFTKFSWGLNLVSVELITRGDPDGQGDLARKNQVILRMENWLETLTVDKSAFRTGLAPIV
jgi:hypothetical protein